MDHIGPVTAPSAATPAGQQKHREGCNRVLSLGDHPPPGLPAGFPAKLESAMAWTGSQLREEDYVVQLTDEDLAEVETAIKAFKALELDGDAVTRERFPLPGLADKLERVGRDLYTGRGFTVVRGLRPADHTVEDLTLAWLGVQAHMGLDRRGRQDHVGNMLVHIVADSSSELKQSHHRHSTAPITFHTEESGDVVSWLTRNTAASGGRCIIASAHTLYNRLAAQRPDVIRTLARSDWPFATPRPSSRAILHPSGAHTVINFNRAALLGSASHPRPSQLASVSARQRDALDLVDAAARAEQLAMTTLPGDMHFINNMAVLHRRDGFVDGEVEAEAEAGKTEETRRRRHLVRMRLRSSALGWEVPEALRAEWEEAFGAAAGPHGGEQQQQQQQVWHLEPMPADAFPLRKYPN